MLTVDAVLDKFNLLLDCTVAVLESGGLRLLVGQIDPSTRACLCLWRPPTSYCRFIFRAYNVVEALALTPATPMHPGLMLPATLVQHYGCQYILNGVGETV